MPSYDYKCTECGHTFEEFLLMNDRHEPTKKPCPKCGAIKTVFQYLGKAPAIGDPVRLGIRKPSGQFREVQSKIAENHKLHQMNMR